MRNQVSHYWSVVKAIYSTAPAGRMIIATSIPMLAMIQVGALIFWAIYGEISAIAWFVINLGYIGFAAFVWLGTVYLTSKEYLLSPHFSLLPNIGKFIAIGVNLPLFLISCMWVGLQSVQPESEVWKSFKIFFSSIPYIFIVWVSIKTFFQYMAVGQRLLVSWALVAIAFSLIVLSIDGVTLVLTVMAIDGFIIAMFFDRLFRTRAAESASFKDCLNLHDRFIASVGRQWLIRGDYASAIYRNGFLKMLLGVVVIVAMGILFLWKISDASSGVLLFYRDVPFFYMILLIGFFMSVQQEWRNTWMLMHGNRRSLGKWLVKNYLVGGAMLLLIYSLFFIYLSLKANQSIAGAVVDWCSNFFQFVCAYVTLMAVMVAANCVESHFFSRWTGSVILGAVGIYFSAVTWVGKVTDGDILIHVMSGIIAVFAVAYVYRRWPRINLAKRGQRLVIH